MENLRDQIDVIDKSIQNLFLERMQVVQKVAKYKKENSLPVFDEKREQEIIKKNIEAIDDVQLVDYYKEFYIKMLEVSKKYQEEIIKE